MQHCPNNAILLGTFKRDEIRDLRGLWQLHMCGISRRFGIPGNGRSDFRFLGRGLRKIRRMLLASQ